ncbi:CBS domain-containing protein [Sulfolobus sp. S-194]|uniref:CBS domain-containing protein n=1 Tax=Sulfolobus sp. S-194 TaxID=2512240 RepID=UPI001436CFCD|nr:CBS domain-containing protein [Sulfolobus sp. S-194]QIW24726.1 CBS domain-containing protein [Sulfolobus sp. S-194]
MTPNKIKLLINKPIIKVQKGTSARDAVKIMAKENVGSILIFDGDKLIGIFTERDLLKAVAREEDLNKPVEELGTTKNLITIDEDSPINVAAELMSRHCIRHLIVVDKSGKPIGVVSIRDIIGEKHILSILSNVDKVEEWIGGD